MRRREMKKLKILIAVVFCLAVTALAVSAGKYGAVCDNAGLFTESQELALSGEIDSIISEYGFDVVIYTDTTTGGKSRMARADDFFDYNGYGIGEYDSGVILFICMDPSDRGVHISTCGNAVHVISNYRTEKILDAITPMLKNGSYYSAAAEFLACVDSYAASSYTDGPGSESLEGSDYLSIFITAAVIALIVALIVVSALKSKMVTVKKATKAKEYLADGSFRLVENRDVYLYRTVTRIRRPRNNSGGGTHISSSGRSHGGGGRSF